MKYSESLASCILILFILFSSCAKKEPPPPTIVEKLIQIQVDTVPVNPNDTTYQADPPAAFRSFAIDKREAEGQVTNKMDTVGFERIFFPFSTFESMLNQSGAVGVRLYFGVNPTTSDGGTIIGIPVEEERKDIYNENSLYQISLGFKENGDPNIVGLTSDSAQVCIELAQERFGHSFYVFLDKGSIETLYATEQSGINFIPGIIPMASESENDSEAYVVRNRFSLIAVPANYENSRSTDYNEPLAGQNYLESKMPCPPDCGAGGGFNPNLPK
jgi:hypothetical protein